MDMMLPPEDMTGGYRRKQVYAYTTTRRKMAAGKFESRFEKHHGRVVRP
jgi:hypothetical protein